jgi:hypothetical protein
MFTPSTLLRLAHVKRVALISIFGIIGCSTADPIGPLGNRTSVPGSKSTVADAAGFGSGTFYPLAIGNAWNYQGQGSFRYFQDGIPGDPDLVYAFTETRRLTGMAQHEGTSYFIEEQVHQSIPDDGNGPYESWIRIRQDREGLFFLDTLLSNPPAPESGTTPSLSWGTPISLTALRQRGQVNPALERLAGRLDYVRNAARGFGRDGSIAPSGLELTELVYPLRVGENWSIRPDFPWPARVDRVEAINTPAGRITAYRLETNPGGTTVHEGEWVRLWWSHDGFVGYSVHLVDAETDSNGEPTGVLYVADESMIVTSMAITR